MHVARGLGRGERGILFKVPPPHRQPPSHAHNPRLLCCNTTMFWFVCICVLFLGPPISYHVRSGHAPCVAIRRGRAIQVMDRQSITRHLLSDPQDPFSRKPLTVEMLEPNDALREEIEEWIR